MDDPLLMGVRDTRADREEEAQALLDRQQVGVAELGDRRRLDQLHDEVREAAGGRPCIEQLRDVGVTESCEGLALDLEARLGAGVVEALARHLEGDQALHRRAPLGKEDTAHAPFAEQAQDPVGADPRVDGRRRRWIDSHRRGGGALHTAVSPPASDRGLELRPLAAAHGRGNDTRSPADRPQGAGVRDLMA